MRKRFYIALLAPFIFDPAIAASESPELRPLENLLQKLEGVNPDIHFAQYNLEFREQNLRAARSLLFPSLSFGLGFGVTKDLTTETDDSSETQSTSSQAQALGLTSTLSPSLNGWSGQLTSTLYLYAQGSISQAIDSAKIAIESANHTLDVEKSSKKATFLQALMEWQWLDARVSPLSQGIEVMSQVQSYASKRTNVLYSEDDRIDLEEKVHEIHYYFLKVTEGRTVVESILRDLIPELELQELVATPDFNIDYKIPDETILRKVFMDQSLKKKILDNDIKIAEGNYEVSRNQKPWVPTIIWTGSASSFGGYDGRNAGSSWSTQLLFSFNLFDGFYSDSRRAQAVVNRKVAQEKQSYEISKNEVGLYSKRMKALVSKSEFELRNVRAKKKQRQLDDVEQKSKRGLSTALELTLARLAYVKAKYEALDALKDYQSAMLSIAVDLNEWEKVRIYAAK